MNWISSLCLAAAVVALVGNDAEARTESYCTGSSVAENPALGRLVKEGEALIESYLAAQDTPGVTAAFTLPDGTTCSFAAGWADKELNVRMTPDHRMHAGSHPKSYTAALALALDHEGVLSLDDPIGRHVGDRAWFKRLPNRDDITIRILMGMAAGLQVDRWSDSVVENARYTGENTGIYNPDILEQWWNAYLPATDWDHIFDQIETWSAPFAPGADVLYTDTQYIMLGLVLEAASGEKIEEAVQRRFHYPLQMTLTAPADRRVDAGVAKGYTDQSTMKRGVKAWEDDAVVTGGVFDVNMGYSFTSGHYFSNPRDLARWLWTFYGGRLLDRPYLDDIRKSYAKPGTAQIDDYGGGVGFETHPELGAILSHDGGMPGYTTKAQYYPAKDFAVAAQFNRRTTTEGSWQAADAFTYALASRVAKHLAAGQK